MKCGGQIEGIGGLERRCTIAYMSDYCHRIAEELYEGKMKMKSGILDSLDQAISFSDVVQDYQ